MTGENYDIDSFLDLSGGLSDSNNNRPSSTGSSTVFPEAPHLALNQSFSGPSHQYELHTQQTGLLPYSMNNTSPNRTPNQSSMSLSPEELGGMGFTGMDLENTDMFSMPSFFPESSYDDSFVDPSDAFGSSQEVDIDTLAGIKTERSKSNASIASSSSSQGKKKGSAAPDAATEERIRQILEDVKRKALSSQPNLDEEPSMPQIARLKKDEEDMDEDERLLASEEGKKLSSKERRQLRNKVSARAFRSRRKEYIGQLETEVSNKASENVDLRRKLNAVEAENKSLKELTRMLLASPQFASFLDQMNPLSASNIAAFTASAVATQQNAMSDNITVHRASVPQIQIQQPAPVMHDFQVPTYIPPHQQFLNTYNPRKDVNPNSRPQAGVEEWPLAYPAPGSWGIGSSTVYAAEVPEIIADANELAGKGIMDDLYAPADGFRPGSFKPVLKAEKEESTPDFSNSYDNNGQYIFNVFEDELEEVPDYLYSHFDIHAPLSQKEEIEVPPKADDVLPVLGLETLFTTLETQFFPESPEPTDVEQSPLSQAATEHCRDPELAKTLRSIESTYRRVGALCGL
ncbi:hypothetical protein H072_2778 [Dactylellina haptotyla CBS 200.50]|uniref:BZIP domain-containing protein n=1 Tax=Dactylellina haptotyla (strain CBS 200.50) TaxID=1284197 RepID=S8BUX4_DACHA|nr:hypothetical protein H072_2778 [Dactylellina haptotyla CBS 200.50]